MEARILLSREKKYWCYSPGDRIEGKLIVNNAHSLMCSGIRVDLEAIVRVNFEEKLDGRRVLRQKVEDAIFPKIYTYVWPINWSWAQITGKLDDERQMALGSSKHVFPFSFNYPLTSLPGSFCSEFGSVQHQVVAYIKTLTNFHKIAVQILNFGDHFNLAFDPLAMTPLRLERHKKSLMFSLVHPTSSTCPMTFTLKLPQRGFLPGEYAPFNLTVINLTGKSLTRIQVSFIQKISYHGDRSKKTLGSVLDISQTVEADSAVETVWDSGFYVPEGVKPTHKAIIEHQYFIKVQIFTKGSSSTPALKSHAPILIGTTRDVEEVGSSRSCICHPQGRGRHSRSTTSPRRGRRTSLDLPRNTLDRLRDDASSAIPADDSSPPPSYSQLSSRAASLDNFLPLYEDAMHNNYFKKLQEDEEEKEP